MNRVFFEILNNAFAANWLIVAVIILRILLKKTPKWISCLLWGLVALRLVLPFSIESVFSLIPNTSYALATMEYSTSSGTDTDMQIQMVNGVVNPVIANYFTPDPMASANPIQIWIFVLGVVWVIGIVLMLLYALISTLMLKRKVSVSIRLMDNVYECDEIESPFILGVIRPRIYLPSGMEEVMKECVLAHEKTHLKRGDHFWKPFGFLILAVYWFNPFCWIAYILLCRDIEYACDEKATKDMDKSWRADYCQALLQCSTRRRMISACPVAFGETGVKERIKSVLNYKKPAFWMIVIALVACVIVSVCFMTNPKTEEKMNILDDMEDEQINVEPENAEIVETEEPNEDVADSLKKWAEAFSSRDGETILAMSSEEVQNSLEDREFLNIGEDYVSSGVSSPMLTWGEGVTSYRISHQDDSGNTADILYYAWTSDPHVSVWHEMVSYSIENGEFVVTAEELQYYDYIASGIEFNEAYAYGISGTLMDYTINGLGEALNDNALLSSSKMYQELFEPESAARVLLNLLHNENKVKLETIDDDALAGTSVRITFAEDGMTQMVTMVQPWGKNGIWIPQDYNQGEPTEEVMIDEVMNRVLQEVGLENAYAWNNTAELKENSDLIIKMATDKTGEYAVYGIISPEYDSYGMLLNDIIDGEDNWNYVYEPWIYTGAPSSQPRLEWTNDGTLTFSYPYAMEGEQYLWKHCIVDAGYETGHMELIFQEESDVDDENLGVSYEEQGGQYVVEGDMVFQYKMVLTGRSPNAETDTMYIVLTNDPDITFEQVDRSYFSSLEDKLTGTIIIGISHP